MKLVLRDTRELASELANLQDIASYLKPTPGDVPKVAGFGIHGVTIPYNGILGGDHIIYLDFKKRYDLEARIGQAQTSCCSIPMGCSSTLETASTISPIVWKRKCAS